MAFATISVVSAILSVRIANTSNCSHVPMLVRNIFFDIFAPLLCMCQTIPLCCKRDDNQIHNGSEKSKFHGGVAVIVKGKDDEEAQSRHDGEKNVDLRELRDLFQRLYLYLDEKQDAVSIEDEWKYLSRIIDHLCFWICLIAIIMYWLYLYVTIHNEAPPVVEQKYIETS